MSRYAFLAARPAVAAAPKAAVTHGVTTSAEAVTAAAAAAATALVLDGARS
ncbi:hypothetical protein ACIGBL_19415 [Streptomyces sp. NPDC085614]|uniref:hypothetical protein n=1 Tax=unclassified Streptomyces TaxID=2593676 RepID=UPI00164EDD02|nr:hypothetical protein [Streptomyces sp. ms191]